MARGAEEERSENARLVSGRGFSWSPVAVFYPLGLPPACLRLCVHCWGSRPGRTVPGRAAPAAGAQRLQKSAAKKNSLETRGKGTNTLHLSLSPSPSSFPHPPSLFFIAHCSMQCTIASPSVVCGPALITAPFAAPPQSSFVGAIAIGDLVKSTLGPKGMVRCCAHVFPCPPPSVHRLSRVAHLALATARAGAAAWTGSTAPEDDTHAPCQPCPLF